MLRNYDLAVEPTYEADVASVTTQYGGRVLAVVKDKHESLVSIQISSRKIGDVLEYGKVMFASRSAIQPMLEV